MTTTAAVAVEAPSRPECPFKGLTPYTEADADFFFGRDRDIEVVIANLEARRLTLLYGESGVGKSSLLRAGVVHRLRETARQNLEEIGTPELVPVYFAAWRDEPLSALFEAIRDAVSEVTGEPAQEAPASGQLDEALEVWSAQADADILVVLDQFEEFFVYHSTEGAEGTFAGELPRAVNDPSLRARFVVSIREDTLAKLDSFKREIPTLFGTYLRIRHLDRESGEQAIRLPIDEYNRKTAAADEQVGVEDKLVGAVLAQVTAGRVVLQQAGLGAGGEEATAAEERIETPYLQLVMTRLWNEETSRGSSLLRVSTLSELGGAETIVRTHLDEALGALPPEEQDVVADLFHYLVTPSGTKIAYAVSDLAAYTGRSEDEVTAVLERLIRGEARILRPVAGPPRQEGPERYEIFHDVLGPAVLDWRTRHVRGRLEREKNEATEQASRERQRARIYRGLALGAFALLIVATGVFAVVQTGRANSAKHRADSRKLASESREVLDSSLDTGILRAVEADAQADTFDARSALLAAVHRGAGLRGFLHFPGAVTAMAIDPVDGKLAVILGSDTLAVRDRDGHPLARLHPSGKLMFTSVAFSPSGRWLAVGDDSGRVRLFTLRAEEQRSGRLVLHVGATLHKRPAGGREDVGVGTGIYGLTFSANGRWLAGRVGYSERGAVMVWDLRGRSRGPANSLGSWPFITALAFSPTAPNLLATGDDSGAELWNVKRRVLIRRIRGSGSSSVAALAFSPKGKALAAGSVDNVVRLWRLDKPSRKPRKFVGHTEPVTALAFSPDGLTLAAGAEDRTVILWAVRTARQVGEPLREHGNLVTSVAFDPQTETLAVASLDGKVSLWDVRERAQLATRVNVAAGGYPHAGAATSRSFERGVAWCALLRARRARARCLESGLDHDATAIATSPTNGWMAAALAFGGIRFWDPRISKPKPRKAPSALGDAYLTDVAFSPDGKLAAAATGDGRIFLWRPGERRPIATLGRRTPDRGPWPMTMAFSPDGTLLGAGYWDSNGSGSVVLWHVAGTTPRRPKKTTMPGGHLAPVLALSFSPDGATLASAGRDDVIKLWNVDDRRLREALIGHTGYVTGLAFSGDGKTLASSSTDETVQLWDVKEGRRLGEPLEAGAPLEGIAFRPTGHGSQMLAAATDDGELNLWGANLWRLGPKEAAEKVHRQLCRVAAGDLSSKARAEQFSDRLRKACGWD